MSNSLSLSHIAALGLIVISSTIVQTTAQANPAPTPAKISRSADLNGSIRVGCQPALAFGKLPEHCGIGFDSEITLNPYALQQTQQGLHLSAPESGQNVQFDSRISDVTEISENPSRLRPETLQQAQEGLHLSLQGGPQGRGIGIGLVLIIPF